MYKTLTVILSLPKFLLKKNTVILNSQKPNSLTAQHHPQKKTQTLPSPYPRQPQLSEKCLQVTFLFFKLGFVVQKSFHLGPSGAVEAVDDWFMGIYPPVN